VPPLAHGRFAELRSGSYTVDDIIGKLDNGTELRLHHKWPVRKSRPILKKELPDVPLLTGSASWTAYFPWPKAAPPLSPAPSSREKQSPAAAGEVVGRDDRGIHRLRRARHEMTEVLTEFPN